MKKIYALVVVFFIAIGVIGWLFNYLSTGTIIITTEDKNTSITLQKTTGDKSFVRVGAGSLSATVNHGQYTAMVKNGSRTATQVINFKQGHQTLRYSLTPPNLGNVEPVAYEDAQGVAATTSQLVYLNLFTGALNKIDGNNNVTAVGPNRHLQAVQWATPGSGIGQDQKGHLYTVSGGSINPLRVPFSYGDKAVSFAVSPDKKTYVSHGADVYAGGFGGGFTKIYTASSSKPALSAYTSGVAVSDSQHGANASNISKPLLATINTSDKTNKKTVEAERMAWSTNGHYLAVVNQSNPPIYNADLKQVAVLPTSSVVGQFTWLNDTTLLYTANNQLWSYDLSKQKSELLANLPSTDSLTGLYVNSDDSYVYMTANLPSPSYVVRRVGLKGQNVPDYLRTLQTILPAEYGNYSMFLVNFSPPPTIVVQPRSVSASDSLTQAKTSLQQSGLNPGGFRYTVSAAGH